MNSLKILAIEDDIDFGETLDLTLKAWGHDVTLSRNWLSVMRTLKTETFDVIIADVETPTGNGLTALKFLNEDKSVQTTTKIFVTGLNDPETRLSCDALNAGYVHKSPTVFDDLSVMLAELGQDQQTVTV